MKPDLSRDERGLEQTCSERVNILILGNENAVTAFYECGVKRWLLNCQEAGYLEEWVNYDGIREN